MYYANKQTFYIRQYGPTVIIGIISLILISSGVLVYARTTNPVSVGTEKAQTVETSNNNKEITENVENTVNEKNDLNETNALVNENKIEEPKTEEVSKKVVKYFEKLSVLKKSKDVNVINVSSSGSVTVEINGDVLEVTLIGIDYQYSNKDIFEKIKSDLLNTKVKVAFDSERTANGKTYAYIYINKNELYNASLLKTGLVTLKSERKNIKLNKELADAQTYARKNSLGIWKK